MCRRRIGMSAAHGSRTHAGAHDSAAFVNVLFRSGGACGRRSGLAISRSRFHARSRRGLAQPPPRLVKET
ncbi:hypothetical protein GLE_4367 [Lysobacter enzymogenes]|uniref:Uncharacterized protein n=1 Tax=Lysobacter enzymogenes TaxID=69 RepID=A0A0S2DMJ0_LYSEN|nr:hypothetical protein GLE_4367 [Lysobacter enzymogenes]